MIKFLISICGLMLFKATLAGSAVWPSDIAWSVNNSDAIVVAHLEDYSVDASVGRFRVFEVLYGDLKKNDALAIYYERSPTFESLLGTEIGGRYLLHLFVCRTNSYVAVIPATAGVVAPDLVVFQNIVAAAAPDSLKFNFGSKGYVAFSLDAYRYIVYKIKAHEDRYVLSWGNEDQVAFLTSLVNVQSSNETVYDKSAFWIAYDNYMNEVPNIKSKMMEWNDWEVSKENGKD